MARRWRWVWLFVAISVSSVGQVQESALQKFRRWLAEKVRIDFRVYDRISRYRGGVEDGTPHGAGLRVLDLTTGVETQGGQCGECWSPIMVTGSEALVVTPGGRLVGYNIEKRTSR